MVGRVEGSGRRCMAEDEETAVKRREIKWVRRREK
jgi:hypothetical protein